MKTLLLSITDERSELGFETVRLPDDVADRILRASEAGARVRIDGELDGRIPEWVAGTPLMPVWAFFSSLWNH